MPTIPVKFFSHDMSGAPALNGLAGSLIAVLDACLKDGFNLRTVQSFVIAGGVGTMNFSSAPGYTKHQVLALAGATDSQYNAAWRVTSVGAMSITVDATGFADATVASGGGLSVKAAPLGWQKAFSDTNLAAYKSIGVGASGGLLRVDDTVGNRANVRGYEAMTDINTGTGLCPTVGQRATSFWAKSITADSVARDWTLIGDDRFFYLVVRTGYDSAFSNQRVGVIFGDPVSYKAGDAFQAMITSINDSASTAYALSEGNGNILHRGDDFGSDGGRGFISRSFSQIGAAVSCYFLGGPTRSGYSGLPSYPNPGDNSLLVSKGKLIVETVAQGVRGELPGYYCCLQNRPLTHGNILEDVVPGRALMVIGTANYYGSENSARWLVDITGPWR